MNSFPKLNPDSVNLDSAPCSSKSQIIKISLNGLWWGKSTLRSKVSDCESLLDVISLSWAVRVKVVLFIKAFQSKPFLLA